MKNNGADNPRIYVACLASYNQGEMHGEWLELEDLSELRKGIEEVLKSSPAGEDAEEYAVHDYDGFGPLSVSEHPDLDLLCKISGLVDTFGEIALHVLANHGTDSLEYARAVLTECYEGPWESLDKWAESRLAEIIKVTEGFRSILDRTFGSIYLSRHYRMNNLGSYLKFDESSWARDLELGGYLETYEVNDQVHIFWTR